VNWIDGNGAVRFFYVAGDNNYFHVPLLFRAVDDRDSRLGTAPVTDYGRTAYISKQEMRQLEQRISKMRLSWCVSRKVDALERSQDLHSYGGMGVKVVFSAGTVESKIIPDEICDTLARLDPAIKTDRALWEFQLYRIGYHCTVPHFNFNAYPDRHP